MAKNSSPSRRRGSNPRRSAPRYDAKASESRKRLKQRILSLEGKVSVLESYIFDNTNFGMKQEEE